MTEVAERLGRPRLLTWLKHANDAANPGLDRLAFKVATGSGKTVVMAMLIAWHALNKIEDPQAGEKASASPVVAHPQVREALVLMQERFNDTAQDGPCSCATFLALPGHDEESARLRMQAVVTVEEFLVGLRGPG